MSKIEKLIDLCLYKVEGIHGCLYDAYLDGYDNSAIRLGYIKDYETKEEIIAYTMGYRDGKQGNKKSIDDFNKEFNRSNK